MRTRDEQKIAAIKEKALDMIVSGGFEALSMQKLAKAAGVSPATIYIYFKDRDDLILQLYKEQSLKFFAAIVEGLDPAMDFATGLKIQWHNRVRFALDHPETTHFMEHITYTPLYDKAVKMHDKRVHSTLSAFTERAIKNQELVKMPFEVFWSVAFAPLYNLVRLHKLGKNLAGEKFELTDKMLNDALRLVLKALKP